MKERRILSVVAALAVFAGAVYGGEIRLPCTRDVWISAFGAPGLGGKNPETETSMGKRDRVKLKTLQENGLFDFDASACRGKTIEKATLYLHERDSTKLRWMGASTVSSDWMEGSGNSDYKPDPTGGASYLWASHRVKPWSYPGSSVTDVTMTAGNTIDSHGEVRRIGGGWLALDIDPKLVSALAVGDSYGLFVMDDGLSVGHNSYVHSREAGQANAPYIGVVLGKADKELPGEIRDLKIRASAEEATMSGGAVEAVFTAPKDAFCYFVTVNGKALERWRTPRPCEAGSRQKIVIDELASGGTVSVGITVCDDAGNRTGPFMANGNASESRKAAAALPEVNHAALFDGKAATAGEPPVRSGVLRVWALGEVEETSPVDGSLVGTNDPGNYRQLNHVWDGAGGRIRLAGLRGEIAAFQLVFEAVRGTADGIQVKISDMKSGEGTIPGNKTELYREWYVGGQPEVAVPLYPGDSFSIPAPDNNVQGQRVQALYCDVPIPADVAAGLYKGVVQVAARGVNAFELPIEVRVYPAEMPRELSFFPELNAYGEPGGAGSEYWYGCHRAAHKHRAVLNVVAYGQNGRPHSYVPPVSGAGSSARIGDWSNYDRIMGPLLDGSAFEGLPREGEPLPVLYMPLCENWPTPVTAINYSGREHGNGVHDEFFQNAPGLDKLFPQAYNDAFVAITRDFAKHFKEKMWLKTELHCYLNNKYSWRESGGGSSWWILDEPYAYKDWEALAHFGRLFNEGIKGAANGPGQPKMYYRGDISRPQFQRNWLKGIMHIQYVGGAFFDQWIAVNNQNREYPLSSRAYGSCNAVNRPSLDTQAWCIKAFLYGADGVLPWQTLANEGALRSPNQEAILIDARKQFPKEAGPVASLRLKAMRRGEQDVEYYRLLMENKRYTREQVRDLMLKKLNLRTEFKQKFSDDAAAVTFGGMSQQSFAEIREGIAQAIGSGGTAKRPASAPVSGKETPGGGTAEEVPAGAVEPDAAGAYTYLMGVVKGAVDGGKAVRVTVEFAGMPMRGTLKSMDDKGLVAKVVGNEITVSWRDLRPVRFYELASRAVDDTAEAHMKLAHYCLGNGMYMDGMKELWKAQTLGAPAEEVEGLRAYGMNRPE
ncbi:MAG: DUF4091 domain-containing protein [Planctomycetes bacterium]|nr:DUF4091 domain-containing protein [Planctomycetota bacterium]